VREGSLVAFTLLTQAAVGTCWALLAFRPWAPAGATDLLLFVSLLAALAGLGASFLHLGRPSNAWRALGNLRTSWLSREIVFASAFTGALAASVVLSRWPGAARFWTGLSEWAAAALGFALVWSMAMAYRLRTVPAWNGWTTNAAFFASALGLGAFAAAAVVAARGGPETLRAFPSSRFAAAALLFHLAGVVSTLLWLRRLSSGDGAGRRIFRRVAGERRRLLLSRFSLSALVLVAGAAALFSPGSAWPLAAACLLAFAAEVAGRALFYEARVRVGL
jgi:anaerobic dimethyl sulfoxide reductase subunit C (anchor subunit)